MLNYFRISMKRSPGRNSHFWVIGQLKNRFHSLLNSVILSMTTTARVNEKKCRRGRRVENAVKGARCWRSSRPLTAFSTPSSLSRVGSEAPLLLSELPTLAEKILLLLFVLMTKNSLISLKPHSGSSTNHLFGQNRDHDFSCKLPSC